MIAACPKCGARYRIEDGRLSPQGARLRCARCEAVFRVRPPSRPEAEAPAPPRPAAARQVAAPAPAPQPAQVPADAPLVLIADPDPEAGGQTARALQAWGLRSAVVNDGVEAILHIQRNLPRVVVLDAALPKMFGFQVCELVKRNESLRVIHVVLVGAIHDRDRYRRPPSETYGADAYVERHELPGALEPILRELGISPRAAAPAPVETPPPVQRQAPPPVQIRAPAPRAAPPAAPAPPVPTPAPAAAGGLDPAEVAKAERLARIVISDIVLYNAEKFRTALGSGDVVKAMEDELQEGRSLFRQRIGSAVRESTDFLARELLRVARERGAK